MMEIATIKEVLEEIQKSLLVVNHAVELLIEDLKEDVEPQGRLFVSINGEEIPVSEGFVSALGKIAKDIKEMKEGRGAE